MTTETRLYTEAEVKAEIDAALKIERKAMLLALNRLPFYVRGSLEITALVKTLKGETA